MDMSLDIKKTVETLGALISISQRALSKVYPLLLLLSTMHFEMCFWA
ncbi:hypothetical protein SAMN05216463_11947 [Xylanibacter ruminicola]|uniref:Uncharacterized protein n=1 Tax=Xylanibacter ruminicola TaxID=839 RepID=A0A1M6X713_XYLRU|nr:hypothetical protein SAMN05216463_11947 [Xylanibacter ruminicola]